MKYQIEDKPRFWVAIGGGLQHVLSIIAATILVPVLIGLPQQISAAIFGCAVGTIAYLLITKRKSPVIVSSNFAFIGALAMTYTDYGYLGILLGGLFAGLVYIVISITVKYIGTKWIEKIFPPIVIGPVVALIGLSLAGGAAVDIVTANGYVTSSGVHPYNLLALLCGLFSFFIIVILSVQNRNKTLQIIPFLFGVLGGYLLALLFTGIGYWTNNDYMKIIDFTPLIDNFKNIGITSFIDYPRFAILEGINEISSGEVKLTAIGVAEIALAFIPISLVGFSEHIADHKNLSVIIERDLIDGEPGLSRTVLGDGVGSILGTFFGICPNTTYGETIGCIAITKDSSIKTIFTACIMCVVVSFFSPLIAFFRTIPNCVVGGMCFVLYGFIAVSGFKMIQHVDLSNNKNLFTLSAILIAGIGGLALQIPYRIGVIDGTNLVGPVRFITISAIAVALIIGIWTYQICSLVEKHNILEEDD